MFKREGKYCCLLSFKDRWLALGEGLVASMTDYWMTEFLLIYTHTHTHTHTLYRVSQQGRRHSLRARGQVRDPEGKEGLFSFKCSQQLTVSMGKSSPKSPHPLMYSNLTVVHPSVWLAEKDPSDPNPAPQLFHTGWGKKETPEEWTQSECSPQDKTNNLLKSFCMNWNAVLTIPLFVQNLFYADNRKILLKQQKPAVAIMFSEPTNEVHFMPEMAKC